MKASQILTMAGAVALILVAQVILPAVLDLFLSLGLAAVVGVCGHRLAKGQQK